MSAQDLLGRIANARAAMMQRGYKVLRIEVGQRAIDELGAEVRSLFDWPEIRTIERREDVEGFILRPQEH